MNKLEITFLCIAIIGFSLMLFDRSYDLGMQEGVAYQKCIYELGYDCTKSAVDEIYLPIEKEIDEYVYPLKLSSEAECVVTCGWSAILCETLNQPKEHVTVYEEDSVYYDASLDDFVHLRTKTSTGWMAGFSKYYGDSKTTISIVPITNEYAQANLELVEAVTDYAVYTGVGWYARDKLYSEVSTLGEKETYAEVDSACLHNEFMGILICYNSTLGMSEIIYLGSS